MSRLLTYLCEVTNLYISYLTTQILALEAAQEYMDGEAWVECDKKQEELQERLENFLVLKERIEEMPIRAGREELVRNDSYYLKYLYPFAKANTPTKSTNEPEVELPYDVGSYQTLAFWAAEKLL